MKLCWRIAFLFVVVVSVGWASIVPAQGVDKRTKKIFMRLDKDGSGRIEAGEFGKGPEIFKRIDRNGDGSLDLKEFADRMRAGGGQAGKMSEKAAKPAGAEPNISPRPSTATTPGLYFVDAHSQMDHKVDEAVMMALMDRGGVHLTLLSPHMRRPWTEIPAIAIRQPGRIVPAVQIKGRGYHKGPKDKYYERLAGQLGDGAFGAMAEAHVFHDSDGGKYQEIRISFDDPLFRAALAGARDKGWPFIVHIEFNALDPDGRRFYMAGLEGFLDSNRDVPIVLIHMAQLEAGPVRRLLDAHANLHFMTSHASPFYQGGGKPFINMFDGQSLKAEWKQLMVDYPERFIFALDNVFDYFWTEQRYLGKMKLWWAALSELPASVAHAVAHGNAERLWKLPAREAGGMTPP